MYSQELTTDKLNAVLCCHSLSLKSIIWVISSYPCPDLYSGLFLSALLISNFSHSTFVTLTYTHNSHFTDPLFELSQTQYEIGQYNKTQYKNSIAQCSLVIVTTVMSGLQYEYYKLLQIIMSKILRLYIIWSWLFFTIIHDLSFLQNLNCSS